MIIKWKPLQRILSNYCELKKVVEKNAYLGYTI